MLKPISVMRTVAIFLALHTATIFMLVFFVVYGKTPSGSMLAMVASIVVAITITIYTAYRISLSINEKLEGNAKNLASFAKQLQTKAVGLEDYAEELKKWASEMKEQQQKLQRRIDLINRYGNRLTELVAVMDNVEDAERKLSSVS